MLEVVFGECTVLIAAGEEVALLIDLDPRAAFTNTVGYVILLQEVRQIEFDETLRERQGISLQRVWISIGMLGTIDV